MSRLFVLLFATVFAVALARHQVAKVEDDQTAAFEEEDNNVVLEEDEDEELDPKIAKVIDDVKAMQNEVKSMHKPELTNNLNAILADAKELKTASASRAKNLKLAIQDRAKALSMQLSANQPALEEDDEDDQDEDEVNQGEEKAENNDEDNASRALEEEEEEKVHKVENDVDRLRSEVKKSNLPKATIKETLSNLDMIVEDARRFSKTHDKNIKKALGLRIQALEEELSEEKVSAAKVPVAKAKTISNKEAEVSQIKKNVADVRSHLHELKVSKKEKKQILKNLEEIESDATRLLKASGKAAKILAKDISSRMETLEEELSL